MINLGVYAAGGLLIASLFALRGTNMQARMAKQRWLADPNPLIAESAMKWQPGPRRLRSRARRAEWKKLDESIQSQPSEWGRLQSLNQEFVAWNDLETAVALAVPASAVALALALFAPHT